MEQKTMGICLSYYREKYRLTQEEICSGICSVVTLSRLEQRIRTVDSLTGEALLGRIGQEVNMFEIMLNEEDLKLWKIREEIEHLTESAKYEEGIARLAYYRKIMPQDDRLHEQFCLYYETRIAIEEGKNREAVSPILLEAIRLTRPGYGEKECADNTLLYSPMEVHLIRYYMQYGEFEHEKQEKELLKLIEFMERFYSQRRREEAEVPILMQILDCGELMNNPEKAMLYLERAISIISQGKGYRWLGELHFRKAEIIEQINQGKAEWEWKKKECAEECRMAYAVFLLEKREEELEKVRRFYGEKLKCPITELEM